jgi:hypothetical protein
MENGNLEHEISFVSFGASETLQTRGKIDKQLKCQVCFVSFDTSKGLRDHIGAFQVSTGDASRRPILMRFYSSRNTY